MNSAATTLQRQFRELHKSPIPGFRISLSDDNVFEWKVGIIGPPDTCYEGGYFLATIKFPQDYPFMPPSFTFDHEFYHPNVFVSGALCISILHPPGDDPMSGEKAEERWNPTQSVESILLSVISLINDPNCSSPANVDAGVLYRNNRAEFNQIARGQVEASKKNIPEGLDLKDEFTVKPPEKEAEDDSFWFEQEESSDEEELEEDSD